MLAAYAKLGVASNTTPTITVLPNPILYVSIFSYFSEHELIRIFRSFEGYDSSRFFPNHVLVRFNGVDNAKTALEDLNATTNLFANYSTKGAKSNGKAAITITNGKSSASVAQYSSTSTDTSSQSSLAESYPNSLVTTTPTLASTNPTTTPKHTIHVTNIRQTLLELKLFFSALAGFKKIAFYQDYCFIIFSDVKTATAAIEETIFKTKMKANFARADFTPHP
ncbi:hypothetical protein HK096_010899, partial [Nowakowskiella sp. JEL0078]